MASRSRISLFLPPLAAPRLLAVAVLCLLSSAFCGCQRQQLYKNSQLMMGTIVEVISPDRKAADIVFREIKRIENLLSFYKDDSEISRLNKQGRLAVSADTLFVVKRAGEFWQATQGAFDITIEPLLKLWGFVDKNFRRPSEEEIKATLGKIGFDKIKISDTIIEFAIENMQINLGGIAKGYAVDCAIQKIRQAGIKSALVNAGGDIYCLGDKFGKPWRVMIKNPNQKGKKNYLELIDKAVATSGNYEQYFFADDSRYCHILNPKTGRPADSGVDSVSVIANDCLTADALATSIFVLGKEKSMDLAKRFNAVVRVYSDVGNNQ